jgi:hypothetical protein
MNGRHTLDGDVCVLRVFEDEAEVIVEARIVGSLSEGGRECDRSRGFRCFEGLVLAVKKPSFLGYAARNGSEVRISIFGL